MSWGSITQCSRIVRLSLLLQRGGELALLTLIHRRGGSDRDVGDGPGLRP